MVEANEESKDHINQQPGAAEEEKSFLCEIDGREHGHKIAGTSWSSVMAEIGHQGEIPSSRLAEVLGDRQIINNNDLEHLPSMLFDPHNVELFDNVHPL